jgi:hypothetical protein
MKITWLSPHGDGWAIAYRLREVGNKVVYCNLGGNKNGQGYLPQVTPAAWLDFAKKSDLVVCDGVPDSRRTRRSFSPSDVTMDLAQVRRAGVPVLGPTPTGELIHNDLRYRLKILKRHGLSELSDPGEHLRVTVSRDPDGRFYLVFRHRNLLGDNNGPDLGNLGDIVLPIAETQPLIANTLGKLNGFLDAIGSRNYLSLDLAIKEGKIQVCDALTSFLYPAVFVQFTNLLLAGDNRPVEAGAAVSILNLESNQGDVASAEDVFQYGGVFGCEIHRKPDEGGTVLHGPFVGAVAALGSDWKVVEGDVNRKLIAICRANRNLGFRPGVGSLVGGHIKNLHSWGYLL